MNRELLITIDPGASGCIVLKWPTALCVDPMPATDGDIVDLIEDSVTLARREGLPIRALVEQVGGYVGGTGQPGSAMFNFGSNYGFLLGVLAALHVRVELVRPQVWQKALGLGNSKSHASKGAWKNFLKETAQRLYPDRRVTLKTADALLLLEYSTKTKTTQP